MHRAAARAGPHTSTSYSIPADSIDSGGIRTTCVVRQVTKAG